MTEMSHWLPGSLLPSLVAGVAAFALGALWYSPLLFAKAWVDANGFSADDVAKMQADAPKSYGISFVCFLLMAHVFAWLAHLTGVSNWKYGMHLGFIIFIGFALTLGLIAHVYLRNRPFKALLIDLGYQFAYLLLMGVIIGAWQ